MVRETNTLVQQAVNRVALGSDLPPTYLFFDRQFKAPSMRALLASDGWADVISLNPKLPKVSDYTSAIDNAIALSREEKVSSSIKISKKEESLVSTPFDNVLESVGKNRFAKVASKAMVAAAVATLGHAISPDQAHAEGPRNCQFILGFQILKQAIPQEVGDCLDNQSFASNGDAQQHTTNGLLAWRKVDNWTAFTDGYRTWVNGPNGIQERLNTERFSFEKDTQLATSTSAAPATPEAPKPSVALIPIPVSPTANMDRVSAGVYWKNNVPIAPDIADPNALRNAIENLGKKAEERYTSAHLNPTFINYFNTQWASKYSFLTLDNVLDWGGKTMDAFAGTTAKATPPGYTIADAYWDSNDLSAFWLSPKVFGIGKHYDDNERPVVTESDVLKEALARRHFARIMTLYISSGANQQQADNFRTTARAMTENTTYVVTEAYYRKYFPNTDSDLRGRILSNALYWATSPTQGQA